MGCVKGGAAENVKINFVKAGWIWRKQASGVTRDGECQQKDTRVGVNRLMRCGRDSKAEFVSGSDEDGQELAVCRCKLSRV